jgi:hypothetical protein
LAFFALIFFMQKCPSLRARKARHGTGYLKTYFRITVILDLTLLQYELQFAPAFFN